MRKHPLIIFIILLISFGLSPASSAATQEQGQGDEPPFSLPFAGPPGPASWLLVQPYGNTVSAYYQRINWYFAGQGLHFGIDLAAPCNTEVLAVADGVVNEIDEAIHGALPHNVMIHHEGGYASFYGHLNQVADINIGQQVQRGQVIGLSGDPDYSCTSRPHLHLEIRDFSHSIAFNPIPFINADWDSIALIGGFRTGFERDLTTPRRWQYLNDQPDVHFGGALLNAYDQPWPPAW